MKQREIKFRAWDFKGNRMVYSGHDDFYFLQFSKHEPPSVKGCHNMGGDPDEHIDGAIIMQYIYRKDKNGKEIYEGDIFRCNGGELPIEKCSVGEIMYSDLGWGAYLGNGCWAEQLEDGEVIGNVFENPELLPK